MLLVSFLLIASGHVQSDVQNEVHEWGVVVFEENTGLMCGETWQSTDLYPDYVTPDMCAEAPVIWIHGEPFENGTFIVTTGEQSITLTYPAPDRISQSMAEWDISASAYAEVISGVEGLVSEEVTNVYDGPFWWAMDSWRQVASLLLYQEYTDMTENFLYYECTVHRDFTDNFFSWGSGGNPALPVKGIQEAILFSPEGIFSITAPVEEFTPFRIPTASEISSDMILNTFACWGRSNLEPMEINALWETWEPVFTEDGSYWLVFPIPDEYHNSISTIRLETPNPRLIVYSRLFLGAVRLNLP
ncbi:MAG: hypothetical protein KAR40_04460 [Candidatus Sabulitectum sp.]|nr:hypothetical protein [Candidatus Sabulitectum sp.]